MKNIAGQVQEEAGKLVGNTSQQAKGVKLQVEGQVQKSLGNAKALVKDANDAIKAAAKAAV